MGNGDEQDETSAGDEDDKEATPQGEASGDGAKDRHSHANPFIWLLCRGGLALCWAIHAIVIGVKWGLFPAMHLGRFMVSAAHRVGSVQCSKCTRNVRARDLPTRPPKVLGSLRQVNEIRGVFAGLCSECRDQIANALTHGRFAYQCQSCNRVGELNPQSMIAGWVSAQRERLQSMHDALGSGAKFLPMTAPPVCPDCDPKASGLFLPTSSEGYAHAVASTVTEASPSPVETQAASAS